MDDYTLKDFVDKELFLCLQNLDSLFIHGNFTGNNNYIKNGMIILQVVDKMNEIDFHVREDLQTFGYIYENFFGDLTRAGNYKEFYIPHPVIEIMTKIINKGLGERVFLTSAIENIKA